MANPRTTLSPRQAILFGLLFIAMGMFPILIAMGVVHPDGGGHTPMWVVFVAGMVFVLGGCSVIVTYGTGTPVDSNGNLDPNTPFAIRATQLALGLALIV